MDTSKLNEHLQRIIDTQSSLAQAGFDLDSFMNTLVERMLVLTPATGAVIELVEDEYMVYRAASGSVAPYLNLKLKRQGSLSGLCVQDREIKISTDTSEDSRVDAEACKRVGAASMVVVPLFRDAESVGVLKVLSSTPSAFSSDDVATLQLMATLLGAALGQQLEVDRRKKLEIDLLQRSQELEHRNKELEVVLGELEKKSEELAHMNEEVLEATRTKSEFLANMSHEIRTPLNAIIGFTDILQRGVEPKRETEYLSYIKDAGHGLLALIGDILDFSKIEAGKLSIEYIDFQLTHLVESTAQLLLTQSHSKHVSLHTFVDPALPQGVCGDPARLRQILLNLLGNAIKFSNRGSVFVHVSLQERMDDNAVLARFEVRDQGVGLSEEEMAKLFRPFVQADGSTTRKFGGTGLGLSICKRLVELMGGEIGVNSKKDSGSTFWFTLPFRLAKDDCFKTELPTHHMSGKKILVVSRCNINSEILSMYLKAWDMQVQCASNDEHAIEQIEKTYSAHDYFDALIVDASSASHEHKRLRERLAANDSSSKIPILAMVDGFEFQSEVSPAGQFASYLRKPIRQIDLLACLSTALKIPGFEELSTNFVLGLQNEKRESLQFRHGRVLVAEDNPANQLVAEAQLSELGLSARMVSNGKEVLSALESEPFLAILMDCQMPEMDGFQSARAIRELEKVSGKHIPIIAMTAGAMEGDRDSCLAAGMDDYVSKPVELDSLRQVLGKWLQKDDAVCANISSGANAVAASTEQDNSTKGAETLSKKQRPSIDIAGLAAMFGRDKVKKILEVFLPDSAISMSKLRAAIHQHDAKALNMLAHKLVGSYSTLRANELAKLSREIEQAALAEDWVTIQKRAKDIDEAYSIVYGESLNFLDEDGDAEPTN